MMFAYLYMMYVQWHIMVPMQDVRKIELPISVTEKLMLDVLPDSRSVLLSSSSHYDDILKTLKSSFGSVAVKEILYSDFKKSLVLNLDGEITQALLLKSQKNYVLSLSYFKKDKIFANHVQNPFLYAIASSLDSSSFAKIENLIKEGNYDLARMQLQRLVEHPGTQAWAMLRLADLDVLQEHQKKACDAYRTIHLQYAVRSVGQLALLRRVANECSDVSFRSVPWFKIWGRYGTDDNVTKNIQREAIWIIQHIQKIEDVDAVDEFLKEAKYSNWMLREDIAKLQNVMFHRLFWSAQREDKTLSYYVKFKNTYPNLTHLTNVEASVRMAVCSLDLKSEINANEFQKIYPISCPDVKVSMSQEEKDSVVNLQEMKKRLDISFNAMWKKIGDLKNKIKLEDKKAKGT